MKKLAETAYFEKTWGRLVDYRLVEAGCSNGSISYLLFRRRARPRLGIPAATAIVLERTYRGKPKFIFNAVEDDLALARVDPWALWNR